MYLILINLYYARPNLKIWESNSLIIIEPKRLSNQGYGEFIMCLAVPAKVININDDDMASIDIGGTKRDISLMLLEDVNVGDYVIVHAGFAIHKINEKDALESLDLLKQVLKIDNV